jgi:hypothetical protein
MKKVIVTAVICAVILMASAPGIRPRADANSYPVHQEREDYSIGAALIPPTQVKKMFAANLNRAGYVVVEIGVFPAPGKEVDLYPADFTLWTGENSVALRAVDGDTIAEILTGTKDDQPRVRDPHDINTSVGVGIGHVSYPDPVTGRRTSGTVTETDAGVGVGGPAPGPAPRPCRGYDCDTTTPAPAPPPPQTTPIQKSHAIAQELWEKSLPDGKTSQAVAGYLYFPKPPGKAKDVAWELRYEAPSGRAKLQLSK